MLHTILEKELTPKVETIDRHGFYPESILRNMGKVGVYRLNDIEENGLNKNIEDMSFVSKVCMTTGFCVWCQDVLGWYLYNTQNMSLKNKLLPLIENGLVLGGTGLSNPMKSYAKIENNHLSAKRVSGGYVLNGTLPWVSNLQYGHYLGVIFNVRDKNHNVMGVVYCDPSTMKLKENIHYSALEGSATASVILKDYFMSDDDVLADPAEPYLVNITPGFILLQAGMAMGVLLSSLDVIKASNQTHHHINKYLPLQESELEARTASLAETVYRLAKNPYDVFNPFYLREVLRARLEASYLVLEATQSACLHAGTQGYLYSAKAQRNLREGYFVAIVTPSIKHLIKELEDIENGVGVMSNWKQVKDIGYYEI
ncbi:acyl-CoA dehydrogenase family protein [Helicobacter sp. 11S02629-2]|uniref:acyl-CoA dehydrogenase family protein n=1 Tax=Helicobacter sp. 11S02629-2 TaxID=1476195 RepID=UPI000BA731ED|nr:acyl-CoA dehydrogenase family protein [Helicobacter sp. 11S02629-2]PAF43516.1 hypothetical protein BKH40_06990 [Helicobacter sp. 11S02629-2]